MRPPARLQAAIELLDEIIVATRDNGPSADRLASRFFSARRYAGSKDRRAIRNHTWEAIRQFGECPANARSAFAALADEDEEIAALFDDSGYGPPLLAPDEPRAGGDPIPQWIIPLFSGHVVEDEQAVLLDRAPLDLRVNRLKADRAAVLAAMPEAEGLAASPDAIRLPTGFPISQHQSIQDGLAEIQDLGSQLIVDACHAAPGMTILDFCAGAGGKTLALSAHMKAEGALIASDTNRDRLRKLTPRSERAGASNIEIVLLNPNQELEMLSGYAGRCDVVLVDAPCSGSGVWRRNPETRWRLTPERLQRVTQEQAKLMEMAATMVTSGGHLVYAVCSLLKAEGQEQVAKFLQAQEGWRAVDPKIGTGRADGDGVLLTPKHDGSDGFFVARLEKL